MPRVLSKRHESEVFSLVAVLSAATVDVRTDLGSAAVW
jgi:hypothetical protein